MINNTIYCIKYIWKIDRKYILLMIVISILTRACMCRNGIAFSSALGDSDNCSNCGCNCLPWNHGSLKLISEAEYQLVEKKLKKDYGVISNITA